MKSPEENEKEKVLSRRQLLFGAVNRFRPKGDESETPSGIEPAVVDADDLLRQGRLDEAVERFREVLRTNVHHVEARSKLGFCLYRQGKYLQASVEFRRILQKGDNNFASLYLGLCQARTGKLDLAVQAWKRYHNLDEILIQRELNLQTALIDEGRTDDPQQVVDAVEQVLEQRRKELASS